MMTNIKWWLISGSFALLVLVLFLVLGTGHRSASIGDVKLADTTRQNEQVYSEVVSQELFKLNNYLNKELLPEDKSNLTAIRERLLGLRVPTVYQNFHLRLVLKLSLLESILAGKNIKSTSAAVQGDLIKLAGEFNKKQN